jgi:hypothetical protein
MNADVPFPLNEPQQRRLTVTLASLEKNLAELRERLERGPSNLRLTHYEDAINSGEVSSLLPTVQDAEAQVRKIADELCLQALTKPVRRKIVAALELANINLYECRPHAGFAGYGTLAPSTADYLEHEIPRLEGVIRSLVGLLQKAYNNAPT